MAPPRPAPLRPAIRKNPKPLTHVRVLIVEDVRTVAAAVQAVLFQAGMDVELAETGAEAMDRKDSFRPDIALIDLMMEHVDGGFVLAYRIRSSYPGTPVIIATNVANETGLEFDAKTSEERSWIKADLMLAKPIRFEQLKREIDRLLATK